eukprot:gene12173-13430_t
MNIFNAATPCTNVYDECPEYQSQGYCERNPEYMQQTCPVTCNMCPESQGFMPGQQAQNNIQYNPGMQPNFPNYGWTTNNQNLNQQPLVQQTEQQTQSNTVKQPAKEEKVKPPEKTKKEKEEEDKDVKELTNTADESDSDSDDEPPTNEQTQPSSKHIEKELARKNNKKQKRKILAMENEKSKKRSHEIKDLNSSPERTSGSGESEHEAVDDKDITKLVETGVVKSVISSKRKSNVNGHLMRSFKRTEFNDDVNSSSERDVTEEDNDEQQEEVSGEEEDDDEDIDSSGNARADVDAGKQKQGKNDKEEDQEKNKNQNNAAQEDKTENAEKYEDEEEANKNKAKPVEQRSSQQKKKLMQNMIENGQLQAYSVSKAKTRGKVPADDSEEVNEENGGEDESTDVDLDMKETGLDAFSSGSGDEMMHLTLRQTYNKQYDNQESPAYKILTGNFEKDMMAALGEDTEISDIGFSETEVEGNPKTSGKVRVNFKFSGNYDKLNKIIKSGNINGLLVVKNSLEGPMLDLKEE